VGVYQGDINVKISNQKESSDQMVPSKETGKKITTKEKMNQHKIRREE